MSIAFNMLMASAIYCIFNINKTKSINFYFDQVEKQVGE